MGPHSIASTVAIAYTGGCSPEVAPLAAEAVGLDSAVTAYNDVDIILGNCRSITSYVPHHASRVLCYAWCPCALDAERGLQPDAVTNK